jgi:hypothetical protein
MEDQSRAGHQEGARLSFFGGFPMFRIRRKKPWAKTAVYYSTAIDPKTKQEKPCIHLECTRGGTKLGPCWGQSKKAVDRALSKLNLQCDCPAQWHKASYYFGEKSPDLATKPDSSAE